MIATIDTAATFDLAHELYMAADFARLGSTPDQADVNAVTTADGHVYVVSVDVDGYATGIGYIATEGDWEPVTDVVVGTSDDRAAVVAAGIDWLAAA